MWCCRHVNENARGVASGVVTASSSSLQYFSYNHTGDLQPPIRTCKIYPCGRKDDPGRAACSSVVAAYEYDDNRRLQDFAVLVPPLLSLGGLEERPQRWPRCFAD